MSENKLYNEPQKERYLSIFDNEGTQTTIRNLFYKSFIYEDARDRDLANFNLEEIGKVINGTNPLNLSVAKNTTRFINSYISWAIENGLRENNISPIDGVSDEWINNFVDKTRKIHYSYSQFLELLDRVKNQQDKAMLFSFFEGISGEKFIELRELQVSDIDIKNNKVFIKSRNKSMEVSPECIDTLIKASNETVYLTYNQKENSFKEKDLLPSNGYVFKNVRAGRTTEGNQVSMAVFYNRVNNLREFLKLEYLTQGSLRQSGMIKMSVDLYKKYGKLEYEQFELIGDKYMASMIHSENYHYYNTTLLKQFISKENIHDLYGIDIEF
jgi:integrase